MMGDRLLLTTVKNDNTEMYSKLDRMTMLQAKAIVRRIAMSRRSVHVVREKLEEAGFDPNSSDIRDLGKGNGYEISVWGPGNEIIRV